jgi:hypothetical protein
MNTKCDGCAIRHTFHPPAAYCGGLYTTRVVYCAFHRTLEGTPSRVYPFQARALDRRPLATSTTEGVVASTTPLEEFEF